MGQGQEWVGRATGNMRSDWIDILPAQWGALSPEPLPESLRQSIISLGNFDGVHLGHRDLIDHSKRSAKPGQKVIAVTLDPHPRALLRPEDTGPPILTLERKVQKLRQAGVDEVIVFRIDSSFLEIRAQDFFDRIIRGILAPQCLIEGDNFCFGRKREGTISQLSQLCQKCGIRLEIHPGLLDANGWISTSRIRTLLLEGDVAKASRLLGAPHETTGEVVSGAQRGRSLGFPTANLLPPKTLVPALGVYAAKAILPNGQIHDAAVNIGPSATFGETDLKIEAHLLNFSGDLYGQTLCLEWKDRIRGPLAFSSPGALQSQIQSDLIQIQTVLYGATQSPNEVSSNGVDDALFLKKAQSVVDDLGAPLVGEGGRVMVVGRAGPALLVRFDGSCQFCPSSLRVLLLGIEEELAKKLPGIEYLEPVMT